MTFGRGVTWFLGGPKGDKGISHRLKRIKGGRWKIDRQWGGGVGITRILLQSPQGDWVSFIVKPLTLPPRG